MSAGQALHLHFPAGSGASFLGPPTRDEPALGGSLKIESSSIGTPLCTRVRCEDVKAQNTFPVCRTQSRIPGVHGWSEQQNHERTVAHRACASGEDHRDRRCHGAREGVTEGRNRSGEERRGRCRGRRPWQQGSPGEPRRSRVAEGQGDGQDGAGRCFHGRSADGREGRPCLDPPQGQEARRGRRRRGDRCGGPLLLHRGPACRSAAARPAFPSQWRSSLSNRTPPRHLLAGPSELLLRRACRRAAVPHSPGPG